jgi:hypothetical protein
MTSRAAEGVEPGAGAGDSADGGDGSRAERRTTRDGDAGAGTGREQWPSVLMMGVHLAALWALAYVQPLFDLLGKNAAFFVARDNTPGDIWIFTLGFTLGPPIVATIVLAIVNRFSRPAARAIHLALMTVLVGTLVLQLIKGVSGSPAVLFPLSLLIGAGVVALYARSGGLRSLVSVLGIAPIAVLVLLLFFSPVNDLVFPKDEATTKAATVASGAAPKTPVVLMIFDELPAMSLMKKDMTVDAQRYPNFGKLAKSSTWYRNATSVSDGTYVAVPAILTGLRPQAELPTSRSYPRNLFSLVGRTYDIHDQEPITHVCPESLCKSRPTGTRKERLKSLARDLKIVEGRILLPDDLADDLPPIDRDWEDFAADAGDDGLSAAADKGATAAQEGVSASASGDPIRVAGDDLPSQRVRAGRAVVRTMKPGSKPGLWMVHYVIPHVPWRFLPDGSQYVVDGPTMPGLDDQTWKKNPSLLNLAWQRHFLMLRFADRLLGDAIAQMKSTGLWDKALVMVVADHGGDISPGGSRRPVTKGNFAAVAGVPMFVKLPGQKSGKVDDTFTTTMDVVPTIAKQLGVQNDWKFDGKPVDEPREDKLLQQRNGRTAKLVGVSPQRFLAERRSYLARQLKLFPSGLDAIWRAGPRDDLLGRSLSGAATGGGRIDNASLYRRVRPTSGVIPAYVTGTISGVASGTDVAISVDGKVRGTAKTFSDQGSQRFAAVVPPDILKRGSNRVEVFTVRGGTVRLVARTG